MAVRLMALIIAGILTAVAVAESIYFLKLNWLPVAGLGLVIGFAVNPVVLHLGTEVAKDDATTFNEYWNGFDTAALSAISAE